MSSTSQRSVRIEKQDMEYRSVLSAVIDAIKPTPEELKDDEALMRRIVRESYSDSTARSARA